MLYFEDFMEDIEDLPYEFKENLTAIRQLDLQVQNIVEPLDSRINDFFHKCNQNGLSSQQQYNERDKILKDFEDVENKNSEKIILTDQMKDTFNKMIKKLDNELAKFKLELEADNPGSAEGIERMVNQQLKCGVSESIQRVERKRIKRGRLGSDYVNPSQIMTRKVRPDGSNFSNKSDSVNNSNSSNTQNDALMTTAVANGSLSPASFMGSLNTPHSTKRKFDWKSNSGSYDRTLKSERRRLKMMSTTSEDSGTNEDLGLEEELSGRKHSTTNNDAMSDAGSSRTPGSLNFGLSSSYNAINSTMNNNVCASSDYDLIPSLTIPSMPSGSSVNAGGPISASGSCSFMLPPPSSSGSLISTSQANNNADFNNLSSLSNINNDLVTGISRHSRNIECEEEDEEEEEPRYCYCNEVSYGDMIGCDAPNCPREWFHYGCVNLIVAPKGNWFCRECKQKIRHHQSQHRR